MCGVTLPHKCWCKENLPWLFKTSAVQVNRCYPKISRISVPVYDLYVESTGSQCNISLI